MCIIRQKCRNKNKKKNLKENIINTKGEYKIKFNLNSLEVLDITVELNEDLSFLTDYFNLNYIYDSLINVKKNDSLLTLFNSLKKKILNYQAPEKLKKFILKLIIYKKNGTLCPKFKFIRLKNGKKIYTFSIKKYDVKDEAFFNNCLKEKYRENEEGKQLLKYFINEDDFQNFDDILSLDNLNVLKISESGRNLDKNALNKLFNIKNNNYSIQKLYLDLNEKYINYDYLFKNIPKFKCLNDLNFINHSKSKKKLLNLIEDIAKLRFLQKIKIYYFEKLCQKEINLIKKLICDISVKEKNSYIKIKKGYDSDDEQSSDEESEM